MTNSRTKKSSASAKGGSAANDGPEPNVSPAASPTAAGGGRKRPSPVRPSGRVVKETDHTNETMATKCHGGVTMIDVKKASGEPAFKAGLKEAVLKGKEGTEELSAVGVFSHKKEPTAESKMVCVGKKGDIPDKVFAAFFEEGPNENEDIHAMLGVAAKAFETYTKPFKLGMPKPKARAGKIVNPDDPCHADEIFANPDVATIITVLYPDAFEDGTFDDDEATADLLGEYFSLISIDEAKEIVLAAYAKN